VVVAANTRLSQLLCPAVSKCDAGKLFDPASALCVAPAITCAAGLLLDPLTQTCVAPLLTCATGTHLDPTVNTCEPDPVVEAEAIAPAQTEAPATVVAGAEQSPNQGIAAAGNNLPYTGMPLGGLLALIASLLLAGILFRVSGGRRTVAATPTDAGK